MYFRVAFYHLSAGVKMVENHWNGWKPLECRQVLGHKCEKDEHCCRYTRTSSAKHHFYVFAPSHLTALSFHFPKYSHARTLFHFLGYRLKLFQFQFTNVCSCCLIIPGRWCSWASKNKIITNMKGWFSPAGWWSGR